jgi:uncharacterized membrane protein
LEAIIHTLHVLLAGTWLGGVVFTTLVLSPALKAMKWSAPERVEVRSAIGKHYARVGTTNLVLLLVLAVLDGALGGFGALLYAEYALVVLLFGLVAAHGAYFGRRLRRLAGDELRASSAEDACPLAKRRRALQRVSFGISMLDLVVSAAVVVLAVGVQR